MRIVLRVLLSIGCINLKNPCAHLQDEVVWNHQDLLLIMGTEILKIDAEMAEKIEVEVGNPHLKTDRKAEI